MFASKDIFLKSSGGYQISRSVRLRSSASAYFNRTFTTPTNVLKWSWSGWVKRGQIGVTYAPIFAGGTSGSAYAALWFNNDNLVLYSYNGATVYQLTTSAVYRDPSAWYHIQIAFDSTQATASNRLAMYVNGVQITAFAAATYPSLNYSGFMNSAIAHYFGQFTPALGASYFDGYLTEINFIDGQALTPSSFGETNSVTGVWQPKKYGGTYGTNGFYLNFSDNSGVTATTIGKDYSGNGNNWTPSAGISITAGATYDSMLDVPTLYADGGNGRGNYCVLNPLDWVLATNTITDGNLNITTSASNISAALGTIAVSSGKWYFEFTPTSVTGLPQIGIVKTPVGTISTNGIGQSANAYVYLSNGNKGNNNSFTAYGATYTNADVIGVALDLDAGTLVFYKNNASQGTAFTSLSGEFFPVIGDAGAASTIAGNINFGQRPFTYTPPTGFVALNTQNLPTPTISNGANYMAATIWTGDATTPRTLTNTVNGVSFQPDLVWGKNRSDLNGWNVWFDSIRGGGQIASNSTDAELSSGSNVGGYVSSYNSNGFTVTRGSNVNFTSFNASGNGFVAWQWNAGGSTVTNTSGSISAQVRANPTAGFSVVTYTGTGANATVGHGLGVAPAMTIIKRRDATQFWIVWQKSLASYTNNLYLQTTDSVQADGNYTALPSSTVLSLAAGKSVNVSTATYVAYCFAAVAGYSAFGRYTGNGSADGPFVYLGFRPRYILIKDAANLTDWKIHDTSRSPYNQVVDSLAANTSGAESVYGSSQGIDILSNGFKIRQAGAPLNTSGANTIFAAFAENPFKFSNAR